MGRIASNILIGSGSDGATPSMSASGSFDWSGAGAVVSSSRGR